MVVLHPGSGNKVSFLPKKVRESQGLSFLTTRMNPAEAESRYSNIERELLAACWSLEKFHHYVYGKSLVIELRPKST